MKTGRPATDASGRDAVGNPTPGIATGSIAEMRLQDALGNIEPQVPPCKSS